MLCGVCAPRPPRLRALEQRFRRRAFALQRNRRTAKQGDIRHSFIVWVDTPQHSGPLGLADWVADPVTGETVAANANLYGAALDSYTSTATDFVQLMNGELQPVSWTEALNFGGGPAFHHSSTNSNTTPPIA